VAPFRDITHAVEKYMTTYTTCYVARLEGLFSVVKQEHENLRMVTRDVCDDVQMSEGCL